jgi:hypothetical protein
MSFALWLLLSFAAGLAGGLVGALALGLLVGIGRRVKGRG